MKNFLTNHGLIINITVNNWLIILTLILLICFYVYLKITSKSYHEIEIDEAEVGIGNQKFKIKTNYEDLQIAYQLWVELSTRKIGLKIDYEHDVITEVYNSWYDFFKISRELVKDIPVKKIRNYKSTQVIIDIAITILNKQLRPHLTKWQAKFRKWYDDESKKEENLELTPQEIQRKYPEYNELISDIEKINEKLIKYRKLLRKVALDK